MVTRCLSRTKAAGRPRQVTGIPQHPHSPLSPPPGQTLSFSQHTKSHYSYALIQPAPPPSRPVGSFMRPVEHLGVVPARIHQIREAPQIHVDSVTWSGISSRGTAPSVYDNDCARRSEGRGVHRLRYSLGRRANRSVGGTDGQWQSGDVDFSGRAGRDDVR